jgi:hypothetical protein
VIRSDRLFNRSSPTVTRKLSVSLCVFVHHFSIPLSAGQHVSRNTVYTTLNTMYSQSVSWRPRLINYMRGCKQL